MCAFLGSIKYTKDHHLIFEFLSFFFFFSSSNIHIAENNFIVCLRAYKRLHVHSIVISFYDFIYSNALKIHSERKRNSNAYYFK